MESDGGRLIRLSLFPTGFGPRCALIQTKRVSVSSPGRGSQVLLLKLDLERRSGGSGIMLKKVVLLAVLALALPSMAVADSQIDFNAQGGTISGSNAGLTLTGSTLIAVNNYFGTSTVGNNLGTVSFTTGALLTGSLTGGGTFSSTGSTVTIVGNGVNGVPLGTIFSGSFTGDLTLTESGTSLHNYGLFGAVTGLL